MNRWIMVLVAAALTPAAAEAQKPSSNMHTRSVDVYLDQANRTNVNADRQAALEKALEAALEGTRNDPDNSKPWFQAGVAYARLGDYVGADSAFDRAEEMWPEYAEETGPERLKGWVASYNAGVRAVQTGDYDAAVSALEAADRIYRKRPEALVTLGALYAQQGEIEKAEQTYTTALEVLRGPERDNLDAQQAQAWEEDELNVSARLATLYGQQGRDEDAVRVYSDLLERQPDNALAKANLASVLTRADRTEEAAALYRELLEQEDLTEGTLFSIGVGLFRDQQFAEAASAFRRAAGLNPQSHETLYNLAQTLYARGATLDREREDAAGARATEMESELTSLNEELVEIAGTLHGIDPASSDVLMMLAHAQRSLAELAGSDADSDRWRRSALATLEAHQALQFMVEDLRVVAGESDVHVTGSVTNVRAEAGTPLRIRFIVVDAEGVELAAEEISVTAPEVDESARFQTTIQVPEGAIAWKYEIIS